MAQSSAPGVLYLTSYPPRECGIATFTADLLSAIHRQFRSSFRLRVIALNDGREYSYTPEVDGTLDPVNGELAHYRALADHVNNDPAIALVHIQHEFGLFRGDYGSDLLAFLEVLRKPLIFTFHTVLPSPSDTLRTLVQALVEHATSIIVMTQQSATILQSEYGTPSHLISVIPHGTHLTTQRDHEEIKRMLGLEGRRVLATFGLLGPNKSIETALEAMPGIIEQFPDVLYLVIGKTHPGEVRWSGESYRELLESRVRELNIGEHVRFVNEYLPTERLLEYLAATDVYLFTSKDPLQAVSGTFSYALASGCPVVATPIPHVREILTPDTGIIAEFGQPAAFAEAVNSLLRDPARLSQMRIKALDATRGSTWENVAIRHADAYRKALHNTVAIAPELAPISLAHLRRMTTDIGLIQFSHGGLPDASSGYTLDDNARAAIVLCMLMQMRAKSEDAQLLRIYVGFLSRCSVPGGRFINLFDEQGMAHPDNRTTNLEDANGRAIWALGTVLASDDVVAAELVDEARKLFFGSLPWIDELLSPRAIAYTLKGLAVYLQRHDHDEVRSHVRHLAARLAAFHDQISTPEWQWYEESMTYANAVLPEAMLLAGVVLGEESYRAIARATFDFLLRHTMEGGHLRVISNDGWFQRGQERNSHGEQSIDVSTTVEALARFSQVFDDERYRTAMDTAMSWYMGNNRLRQIIYDPISGGCYDGLERAGVNINQGAESTVCYLIARLLVEHIHAEWAAV